jgi:uncharacterized membrane protein (UPF0127 family)
MMRWGAVALLLSAAFACNSDGGAPGQPATVTPTNTPAATASQQATVIFHGGSGDYEMAVEIADDPQKRSVGLMHRETLPDDAGMLFAWEQETTGAFWMRNTLIPLSIAFIKADGTIVHIEDMEPLTDATHVSPEPFRFAVEANQGWFASHGVGAGDVADVPAIASR